MGLSVCGNPGLVPWVGSPNSSRRAVRRRSMAVHFINASDLMGPDWRFLAQVCDDPGLTWETVSGQPRGVIERRIRRPNLGRYRAAFEAARGARRGYRQLPHCCQTY